MQGFSYSEVFGLKKLGAKNVLIKGGHSNSKILTDVFNFIYIFGAARETRTLTGKPHLALNQACLPIPA